jgi:hypothetical protein
MTKAKRSPSLVPETSSKSNNVNKSKLELYFRLPAFNKKEGKRMVKNKTVGQTRILAKERMKN